MTDERRKPMKKIVPLLLAAILLLTGCGVQKSAKSGQDLMEGIHLRSYAQNNPLREYKNEGYVLFDELLAKIDAQATTYLVKAEVRQNSERKKVAEGVTNENKDKVKKASPKRVEKIGRNDKCPCGSGKKYKQCWICKE